MATSSGKKKAKHTTVSQSKHKDTKLQQTIHCRISPAPEKLVSHTSQQAQGAFFVPHQQLKRGITPIIPHNHRAQDLVVLRVQNGSIQTPFFVNVHEHLRLLQFSAQK